MIVRPATLGEIEVARSWPSHLWNVNPSEIGQRYLVAQVDNTVLALLGLVDIDQDSARMQIILGPGAGRNHVVFRDIISQFVAHAFLDDGISLLQGQCSRSQPDVETVWRTVIDRVTRDAFDLIAAGTWWVNPKDQEARKEPMYWHWIKKVGS